MAVKTNPKTAADLKPGDGVRTGAMDVVVREIETVTYTGKAWAHVIGATGPINEALQVRTTTGYLVSFTPDYQPSLYDPAAKAEYDATMNRAVTAVLRREASA